MPCWSLGRSTSTVGISICRLWPGERPKRVRSSFDLLHAEISQRHALLFPYNSFIAEHLSTWWLPLEKPEVLTAAGIDTEPASALRLCSCRITTNLTRPDHEAALECAINTNRTLLSSIHRILCESFSFRYTHSTPQ